MLEETEAPPLQGLWAVTFALRHSKKGSSLKSPRLRVKINILYMLIWVHQLEGWESAETLPGDRGVGGRHPCTVHIAC